MNKVLQRVREKKSKIVFKKIGNRRDFCMIGAGNDSYHYDSNSVSGQIIILGS